MAHAQKPDFVFWRNGRVHLNRLGRQFSRLLAAEVCASAVVMLDTPCSEVVGRVLVTHSILQFPLHFPSLRRRVPSRFSWSLHKNRPLEESRVIFGKCLMQFCSEFYGYGSVHHYTFYEITNRCNYMQSILFHC